MSNKTQGVKKATQPGRMASSVVERNDQPSKSKKGIIIAIGIAVILIAAAFTVKGGLGGSSSSKTASSDGDLTIPKSEISETAKFYPYSADGKKLEIWQLKLVMEL